MTQMATLALSIDWARFALVRDYADRRMPRLLQYFEEDAGAALRSARSAHDGGHLFVMIGHLEQLRRDSVQLGALGVAQIAEEIETQVRDVLDFGDCPAGVPAALDQLDHCLLETLSKFRDELSRFAPVPRTVRSPILQPERLQSSPA